MRYISTRGGCPPKTFEEVVLTGLAPGVGCLCRAPYRILASRKSLAGDLCRINNLPLE